MDVVTVRPAVDPGLASRNLAAPATAVPTELAGAQAVASLAKVDRARLEPRREPRPLVTRRTLLSTLVSDEPAEPASSVPDLRLRAYAAAPPQDEPARLSTEA